MNIYSRSDCFLSSSNEKIVIYLQPLKTLIDSIDNMALHLLLGLGPKVPDLNEKLGRRLFRGGEAGRWHILNICFPFPGRFQHCWVSCSRVFFGWVEGWGGALEDQTRYRRKENTYFLLSYWFGVRPARAKHVPKQVLSIHAFLKQTCFPLAWTWALGLLW